MTSTYEKGIFTRVQTPLEDRFVTSFVVSSENPSSLDLPAYLRRVEGVIRNESWPLRSAYFETTLSRHAEAWAVRPTHLVDFFREVNSNGVIKRIPYEVKREGHTSITLCYDAAQALAFSALVWARLQHPVDRQLDAQFLGQLAAEARQALADDPLTGFIHDPLPEGLQHQAKSATKQPKAVRAKAVITPKVWQFSPAIKTDGSLPVDLPNSPVLLEKIRTVQDPSVGNFLLSCFQDVSEEFLRKGSLRDISDKVAGRLYIGPTHQQSIESALIRMKIFDTEVKRNDHGNKRPSHFLLPRDEIDGAYVVAGILCWLVGKYPNLRRDTRSVTIAWREDIPQIWEAFGYDHPWAQRIHEPISRAKQPMPDNPAQKVVDAAKRPERQTTHTESEKDAWHYFKTQDRMDPPPFTDREELDAIERITVEDIRREPARIPSHADTAAGDCTDKAMWYAEQVLLLGKSVHPREFPLGTTEFQMYGVRLSCANFMDRYTAAVEKYNENQPDERKKKRPITNLLQFVRLAYWRDQKKKGRLVS